MIATLTYNLPDDQEEFDRACAALALCGFIYDMKDYLRTQCKYAEDPDDIERVMDKFHELMNEHNIDLDKLYK